MKYYNMKCCWYRRGGPESSEVHPSWNSGITPDLLPSVLWCVCCPHPYDAVLFAQRS